ncbi:MAG: tetratricopeptide repeat protein [Nitrospirota bacterium]
MKKVLCGIVLVVFSLSIAGCMGMMMPSSFRVMMKAENEAGKGNPEKAINRLEEYQKTHPDMSCQEMEWHKGILARCYEETGKTNTAISILEGFLKEQPYQEQEEPYFHLARLYLKQGDKQKAETMFEKAKESAQINLELNIGMQYEEAKELDKAMEIYTGISQKAPYCYKAYTCLGNISRQKGNLNQAINSYEKDLELNPADIDACMWLGALDAISGKKDKAKASFEKVVKICQWQEAIKPAKAVITFLNSDAYTEFLQDKEHLSQGDMNAGISACKEKITQEPQTLKWHFYLAVLSTIKGEDKEAKQGFKKVISLASNSDEAKLSKAIMSTLSEF